MKMDQYEVKNENEKRIMKISQLIYNMREQTQNT